MTDADGASQGGRFAKNVFWSWLGLAASLAAGFLLAPYMIRKLGDEGYGIWALVFSLVEYFGVLDMGFRSATIKFTAHYRTLGESARLNEVVNSALLYYLLIALVVIGLTLLVVPFVDRLFVISPARVGVFRWLVLLLGCNYGVTMLGLVFQAGLEGFGRFDLCGRTAILLSAVRVAGIIVLLAAGGGILSLAVFVVAAQTAAHAFNLFQFKWVFPDFGLSPRAMKKSMLRELSKYGVHTMTAAVAYQLLDQLPQLLIAHLRSAVAVGYFNVPWRLMQTTGVEMTVRAGSVTNTRAAELCAKGDLKSIGKLGVYTNRYCLALFLPLAIFLLVYGRAFLNVWIKASWADAAAPLLLPLVILTAFAVSAQMNTASILYGLAEHRPIARSLLAEGVLTAVTLPFVIQRFGIEGAAWNLAIFSVLNRGLFNAWVLCRRIGWSWRDYMASITVGPLLTAVPVFALAWVARGWFFPGRNWPELILAGLTIALLYGLLAFYTCLETEHRGLALRTAGWVLRMGS